MNRYYSFMDSLPLEMRSIAKSYIIGVLSAHVSEEILEGAVESAKNVYCAKKEAVNV